VVGESTVHLYQAYADFGFDPRNMPIASLTTTEVASQIHCYGMSMFRLTPNSSGVMHRSE
jgi:Periplasmic binding protein domain